MWMWSQCAVYWCVMTCLTFSVKHWFFNVADECFIVFICITIYICIATSLVSAPTVKAWCCIIHLHHVIIIFIWCCNQIYANLSLYSDHLLTKGFLNTECIFYHADSFLTFLTKLVWQECGLLNLKNSATIIQYGRNSDINALMVCRQWSKC